MAIMAAMAMNAPVAAGQLQGNPQLSDEEIIALGKEKAKALAKAKAEAKAAAAKAKAKAKSKPNQNSTRSLNLIRLSPQPLCKMQSLCKRRCFLAVHL